MSHRGSARNLLSESAVGFLYVALVAVVALAVAKVSKWFVPDPYGEILEFAWYLHVTALLGVWFGFSQAPWSRRVLGLIVGMAVLGVGAKLFLNKADVFIVAAAEVGIQVAMLGILRLKGIGLQRAGRQVVDLAEDARTQRQISIRDLLFWVIGFAVLFSVMQRLRMDFSMLFDWELACFATIFGVTSLVASWAALGTPRWPIRMVVFMAFTALGSELGQWIEGHDQPQWFVFMTAQSLLVAGELWILRARGFRIGIIGHLRPEPKQPIQ